MKLINNYVMGYPYLKIDETTLKFQINKSWWE